MTKKINKITTIEKIYLSILVIKTQFYNNLKYNYKKYYLDKENKRAKRFNKTYKNIEKAFNKNNDKYNRYVAKLQYKILSE